MPDDQFEFDRFGIEFDTINYESFSRTDTVSTTTIVNVETDENTALIVPYQDLTQPNFFDRIMLEEDAFFAPVVNPVLTVLSDITNFLTDSYNAANSWIEDNFNNIRTVVMDKVDEIGTEFNEIRSFMSIDGIIDKVCDIIKADVNHKFMDKIQAAMVTRFQSMIQEIADSVSAP